MRPSLHATCQLGLLSVSVATLSSLFFCFFVRAAIGSLHRGHFHRRCRHHPCCMRSATALSGIRRQRWGGGCAIQKAPTGSPSVERSARERPVPHHAVHNEGDISWGCLLQLADPRERAPREHGWSGGTVEHGCCVEYPPTDEAGRRPFHGERSVGWRTGASKTHGSLLADPFYSPTYDRPIKGHLNIMWSGIHARRHLIGYDGYLYYTGVASHMTFRWPHVWPTSRTSRCVTSGRR